jgi:hypothetical protein
MHQNSLDAYPTVAIGARQQELLVVVLTHGPGTAQELQKASETKAGLWKRAPELEKLELIDRSLSRTCAVTGQRAMVLRLTDLGRTHLRSLGHEAEA